MALMGTEIPAQHCQAGQTTGLAAYVPELSREIGGVNRTIIEELSIARESSASMGRLRGQKQALRNEDFCCMYRLGNRLLA
ncbi:MAG: hypothetical protein N3G20_03345 [Verrucomicrobiae bacterium]|nr:hypothetical protein [Verrucomicrobiae bacterium]